MWKEAKVSSNSAAQHSTALQELRKELFHLCLIIFTNVLKIACYESIGD